MQPSTVHWTTLPAVLGITITTASGAFAQTAAPYSTWRTYGGGAHASQYSSLDQINRANVNRLEIA